MLSDEEVRAVRARLDHFASLDAEGQEERRRRSIERRHQAWWDLLAQPQPGVDAVVKYLGQVGAHERRAPLMTLWRKGALPQPVLNRVLAEWWSSAGYPSEGTISETVRLFKDAGFVTDRADIERPTAPLLVYRGQGIGEPRGVCWTTDLDVARFFAYRDGKAGRVMLRATVPPYGILGLFFERNEAEVLVNPRTLRGITEQREAA